jgi:phosphonopyruvate decarboxylase
MLLMIGWRGEPGIKDEPQHIKQGRVTPALLDAMEIPWFSLDAKSTDPAAVIAEAVARMGATMAPVALLVRKGTFQKYKLKNNILTDFSMNREQAIKGIVDSLVGDEVIVSTTGMASRELYEYRVARGDGHGSDFLTVGSMGHTASIAMGLAQAQSARRTICLDGDGSAIMHMGALAIIGQSSTTNLVHIIVNNGAHDSVGGQPTAGFGIDLVRIAEACGYRRAVTVSQLTDLKQAFSDLCECEGPVLLEIRVNKGARADLGRPKTSPVEIRDALMDRLDIVIGQNG